MKRISLFGTLLALAACSAPMRPSAQLSGEDLYARNCAACHGRAAEGDGPVASVMTLTVPDLRGLAERNNGVFPRETVVEYIDGRSSATAHGDRYMPVWGDEFRLMANGSANDAQARIERLTDFLASIQYGAGGKR
jgi:mono/diheme cytochrome c family protein